MPIPHPLLVCDGHLRAGGTATVPYQRWYHRRVSLALRRGATRWPTADVDRKAAHLSREVRTMNGAKIRVAMTLAAVALVGLAACSSSGGSSNNTPATNTATTTAPTAT